MGSKDTWRSQRKYETEEEYVARYAEGNYLGVRFTLLCWYFYPLSSRKDLVRYYPVAGTWEADDGQSVTPGSWKDAVEAARSIHGNRIGVPLVPQYPRKPMTPAQEAREAERKASYEVRKAEEKANRKQKRNRKRARRKRLREEGKSIGLLPGTNRKRQDGRTKAERVRELMGGSDGWGYASRNRYLKGIGFTSYGAYLKSELWAAIRDQVFREKGRACLACGAEATQLHHLRYHEDDLVGKTLVYIDPICRSCHDECEFTDGAKSSLREANARYSRKRCAQVSRVPVATTPE